MCLYLFFTLISILFYLSILSGLLYCYHLQDRFSLLTGISLQATHRFLLDYSKAILTLISNGFSSLFFIIGQLVFMLFVYPSLYF